MPALDYHEPIHVMPYLDTYESTLVLVWMHMYPSESTSVEVDWSGVELN
jgi:hypothetical protein